MKLCDKLTSERDMGQRLNIIIVAEGARDRDGQAITAEDVKKGIVDNIAMDTRITVLGHVQRGGSPSAFDRLLGCRMGAEAVLTLMEATSDTEPCVVSLDGNQTVRVPLMGCVLKTQAVARAMADKDFEEAVKMRGRSIARNLETYKMLTRNKPPEHVPGQEPTGKVQRGGYNLAVLHVGAPACGMNAAVRSFVRNCIFRGDNVYGVHDGFQGLVEGNIRQMTWSEVSGWVGQGGAFLGTKRTLPEKHLAQVAARFKEYRLHSLLIVGGFEAYHSLLQLHEARDKYPEFCIPMVVIPATISNNVPGSDFSLGCDTSLNEIVEICDRIRQSAQGTKRRVFVVETMGGYSGYLCTLAGLAGGLMPHTSTRRPLASRSCSWTCRTWRPRWRRAWRGAWCSGTRTPTRTTPRTSSTASTQRRARAFSPPDRTFSATCSRGARHQCSTATWARRWRPSA